MKGTSLVTSATILNYRLAQATLKDKILKIER